ncbi:MAG TPA: hypothetical protein VGF82_18535 [Terracidiphilus sp.]
MQASDVIFVAVGIPPSMSGDADLCCVQDVVSEMAAHITSPKLVVAKSTVPHM